jgi:hypothetical protein
LFNVADDPHELNDLADSRPEVVHEGLARLERWTTEMMRTSEYVEDPLWTVMSEGGPYHTRDRLARYAQRLRQTGRDKHAQFLEAHPTGLA